LRQAHYVAAVAQHRDMTSQSDFLMLLPQVAISAVTWAQLVLSMNHVRDRRVARADVWACLVSLHAGVVRWVAAMSTRSSPFGVQLVFAGAGATLGWTCFVIIFNRGFVLASRQQLFALVMSLLVTVFWETHNRILFESGACEGG